MERAFAVKAYFSNDRSIITTQCAFHTRSNIEPHGRFSGRHSIASWMNNFRKTGSVKEKNQGPARTERSPQNIDLLGLSVLRSRTRQARKHTSFLKSIVFIDRPRTLKNSLEEHHL